MSQGKVSVIMPLYNAAAYMERSIDSVLNQSYGCLQVILIDDGSSDETLEKANEYAAIDSRIVVISQPNSGPGVARNTGLQRADGDYVCFIDSDDLFDVHAIERMVSAIGDATLLQCRSKKLYSDGRADDEPWPEAPLTLSSIEAMQNYLYVAKPMVRFSVWAKLYKREVLKDIRFPVIKYSEDVVFNALVIQKSHEIRYIPDTLYFVDIRADSLSHSRLSFEKILSSYQCNVEILNIVEADDQFHHLCPRALWSLQLSLMGNACRLASMNCSEFAEYIKKLITLSRAHRLNGIPLSKKLLVLLFRTFPRLFIRAFRNKLGG